MQEDDNIVRCPAGEEGEDDHKYEFDGPALLPHACGQDADGDANVAVHHHEQREEEEEQELLVITDQTPALHGALRVSRLLTHQSIKRTLPHILENQLFQTCNNTDAPYCYRRNDGIHLFPAPGSCHCMHHCQVSVKRHKGEEEDGAVEAYEVCAADQLTHSCAKNPLGQMVRCPEGETGGKEDVGEDQIQEENVCHCVELLILVNDEEDKPIAKVTQ